MALPLFISRGKCLIFSNFVCLNTYKNSIRGLKSGLNIKWIRPQKVPFVKPERSGDLQPFLEIDKAERPLIFQNSEELRTADDIVKRLFTLEFWPQKETIQAALKKYTDSVKRHELDEVSLEAKIARLTMIIRRLQQHIEDHPYDRRNKVVLKELIEKRTKRLKELRRSDYKCFEWVLENLSLIYKPRPPAGERVERKRSLRRLTDLYCEEVRKQRLEEYKAELNAQKENFLKKKAETLQWIMKEEKECGVEPTVTQEQVDTVLKQLEDLKLSCSDKKDIKK